MMKRRPAYITQLNRSDNNNISTHIRTRRKWKLSFINTNLMKMCNKLYSKMLIKKQSRVVVLYFVCFSIFCCVRYSECFNLQCLSYKLLGLTGNLHIMDQFSIYQKQWLSPTSWKKKLFLNFFRLLLLSQSSAAARI